MEEPKLQEELLYDLRQTFVILATEIKKEIIIARVAKDFPRWKDLLDSLFIEITKNLTEEELKEYEKLDEEVSKIINKYPSSYMRKTTNNAQDIYSAIRKLDIWINRKMNEKNMFGIKEVDDWRGL